MKEVICTYKNEVYSVREDGSVMRHPLPGKKPRPTDNAWVFGKVNIKTEYPEIAAVVVHRIVCTAFNGVAPSAGHVVDHIDTNKQNNRPKNLRWVTRLENILLNPVTVKRIEYACGISIEEWLVDPAKFRDKFQQQDFSWMRSVTAEEGKLTLERFRNWAKQDKMPTGGKLGEWIYSRGNLYEHEVKDLSAIIPSKTPNALQRNYKMVCDFNFCPPSVDGDPIAAYARRLGWGNPFVASDYSISVAYGKTISEDGSTMYVISASQGRIEHWGLAKVTYDNGQFLHENIGVFLERREAERKLAEVQGLAWTDNSNEESIDLLVEKFSNTIDSQTPGAVQRNWKTASEFPGCPEVHGDQPLVAYERNLVTGSVFCSNDYWVSTVHKTQLTNDDQSLYVITKLGSDIKPWAIAKVTYEDGLFVHESLSTFFELRGAERMLCEAQGLKWTGEEGIDDYS